MLCDAPTHEESKLHAAFACRRSGYGDCMKVGFVGLGAMGLPMTRHLIDAGHDVTVASRSRAPIESAVAAGATEGDGPAGVVSASQITIVCVPNSPDVVQVLDGALRALSDGKIVVDASTIDPDVERAQHERVNATGARYLEAPLSGGTVGAKKGTLTLMVGGDADVLAAARPALAPFAGSIVYVGGPGTGQIVKLCNNLIYAAQTLAVAEATTMAAKAGVDLRKLHEVITQSTGDCNAIRTRIPFEGVLPDGPASNNWQPGFMTDLMAKDLDLAIGLAARADTPLFTSGIVRQLLGAASAAGYGREDFSSLGKIVRQLGKV
jgi:3-hydroxyisobutyrate dehydrogenase